MRIRINPSASAYLHTAKYMLTQSQIDIFPEDDQEPEAVAFCCNCGLDFLTDSKVVACSCDYPARDWLLSPEADLVEGAGLGFTVMERLPSNYGVISTVENTFVVQDGLQSPNIDVFHAFLF